MTTTPTVGSRQGINALKNGIQIGGTTISTGDGTPSATYVALRIGDLYVDYTNGALYIAGATGSGNWTAYAGLTTSATSFTTTTTLTVGTKMLMGTTGSPTAINTANDRGIDTFFSTTATSGTTYGMYLRLDSVGAGVEAIGGRFKVLLTTGAASQAHGVHGTLEYGSSGNVADVGSGIKGNFVVNGRVITGGEVYGMMAELYYDASGSTASVRHAPLCISVAGNATGMATCKNAIAVVGSAGSGNMIYIHTAAGTQVGTLRILVNGTAYWLPLMQAE